jgi:hypothetical protein
MERRPGQAGPFPIPCARAVKSTSAGWLPLGARGPSIEQSQYCTSEQERCHPENQGALDQRTVHGFLFTRFLHVSNSHMALPLFWMTSGGWSHASRHEAE